MGSSVMQARLCSGDGNRIAGGDWLALDSVLFSRAPWSLQATASHCTVQGGEANSRRRHDLSQLSNANDQSESLTVVF